MLYESRELKRDKGTDQELFDIAVLTLCWPRSVPDYIPDEFVSARLNEWWEANKDHLPWRMDSEAIDKLWWR